MKAKTVRLGEVGEIISGATPRTAVKEFWDGDVPWITPADLSNHEGVYFDGKLQKITRAGFNSCSAVILPPGSILFSSRAPIGHSAVTAFPLCTNQGFKSVIPSQNLDPVYGYFALKRLTPSIVAKGRGATFAEVSKEIMEEVEILLPPLPEQRRIAARLEQADRLRRTRRSALDLADSFLPAAFLEMFGEPASNERGHPLQPVEELFPTGREGSKCGPFGSALRNDEYTPVGIPVWTMENIAGGEFREEGSLYISPAKYDELKSYTVQNGDILISRAGTVGRMAILATKHERSIIHSNLVRLTLDLQRCLPIYFTVLMKYFGSAIGRLKRGAEDAYSFMNTGRISELRIPVPPLPLQRRFAALVDEHERLRAMQREALRQAEHLFQTLLHNAFADGAA